MQFETIKLDISGGAARITLNRPDRMNAINYPLLTNLHQALRLVHAAVPSGEAPRAADHRRGPRFLLRRRPGHAAPQ